MEQNQEVHLARGDAAKQLLKSEAFTVVTNELVNGYVAALVQSKPEEAASREMLYAHIRAVQDIAGALNQWVSVAAQIRAAAEDAEEDNE